MRGLAVVVDLDSDHQMLGTTGLVQQVDYKYPPTRIHNMCSLRLLQWEILYQWMKTLYYSSRQRYGTIMLVAKIMHKNVDLPEVVIDLSEAFRSQYCL